MISALLGTDFGHLASMTIGFKVLNPIVSENFNQIHQNLQPDEALALKIKAGGRQGIDKGTDPPGINTDKLSKIILQKCHLVDVTVFCGKAQKFVYDGEHLDAPFVISNCLHLDI